MNKLICQILICCYLLTIPSTGFCSQKEEQYYVLLLDGKRNGYAHYQRKVSGASAKSDEFTSFTFSRGGTIMKIEQSRSYVETIHGTPQSYFFSYKENKSETTVSGKIGPDNMIHAEQVMMNRPQDIRCEYPKGALMPEGLLQEKRKLGLKPGTRGKARIFLLDQSEAADLKWIVKGKERVSLLGETHDLIRIDETTITDNEDIKTTSWVNDDYQVQKTVTRMAGLELEMIACRKTVALQPPETIDLFSELSIKSPRALSGTELRQGLEYEIKPLSGRLPDIPENLEQSVNRSGNGSIYIAVKPKDATNSYKIPYSRVTQHMYKFLAPSASVQSHDRRIHKLAKEAIGDETDALTAAKKIELFVNQFIEHKNLSTGSASALEVMESREGDCSEHAVLTAALCRSIGIPAKISTGLVYVGEFDGHTDLFMPHAWVQAYIGTNWFSLDAAFISAGGFGAGHILLGQGPEGEGDSKKTVSMLKHISITRIRPI